MPFVPFNNSCFANTEELTISQIDPADFCRGLVNKRNGKSTCSKVGVTKEGLPEQNSPQRNLKCNRNKGRAISLFARNSEKAFTKLVSETTGNSNSGLLYNSSRTC